MVDITDVSIDIETLSTAPTAAILSIGAVGFSLGRPPLLWGWERNVSPHRSATVDIDTVRWWLGQDEKARLALSVTPVSEVDALHSLSAALDWSKVERLWCNGPQFDEAILHSAYLRHGRETPWKYNTPRDMKTYCLAAGLDAKEHSKKVAAMYGFVPHRAYDDAVTQMYCIQEAHRLLNQPKLNSSVEGIRTAHELLTGVLKANHALD